MKMRWKIAALLLALASPASAQNYSGPGGGLITAPPAISGTLQSAAVANGNGTTLATVSQTAVALTVNCATCSGGTTVNFEGTQDGTNFAAIFATISGTTTTTTSSAASGINIWNVPVAGLSAIRARISGYSAGTVTVTGTATGSDITLATSLLSALTSPVPACGAVPCTTTIGNIGQVSPYPVGATAITASSTGTTGATTATLAGTSGKTTYICSMSIRANATAAATANSTVTGTITGTLNFTQWTAAAATGIGLTEEIFVPCVPASSTNTGIAVISAAPGTGGVVSVSATGFQL